MSDGSNLKLHIGCGLVAPENWVNIDGSWNAWLAKFPSGRKLLVKMGILSKEDGDIPWPKNIKIHDVNKGLPFSAGVASAIYASHLLEHLSNKAARHFLRECCRVLKAGGIIRLVIPDIEFLARKYLADKESAPAGNPKPAKEFAKSLCIATYDGKPWVRLAQMLTSFEGHKWFYDADSLKALLIEAGFTNVQLKAYLNSRIHDIADVEREGRLEGAICVEGVKSENAS